jgi:NAD+ synthase
MAKTLNLALAQVNVTVGALESNTQKIKEYYESAAKKGADLVVFPELTVIGYPPEDLVLRTGFQRHAMKAIEELAATTKGKPCGMIVGGIAGHQHGLFNAAYLLADGKIQDVTRKYSLPNYGVFDEKRVFAPGPVPRPLEYNGVKLGILICEDMWDTKLAIALAKQGAEMLIAINASPFEHNKQELRYKLVTRNVMQTSLPLIYVNQVGGQDELVFEGNSFVINPDDSLACVMPAWEEALTFTRFEKSKAKMWVCTHVDEKPVKALSPGSQPLADTPSTIYCALVMGLHDYIEKNGFPGIIIGMSGGIDSALSAAIAVDALGASRVRTVMMPSPYTSRESITDAEECAKLLGVQCESILISPMMDAFALSLQPFLKEKKPDITEENLQSRIRGNLLMALSNASGYMVLTTGNKSEMAVGYATLYGDMCGGFSVLKDIYKSEVYKLSRWRNEHCPARAKGKKGRVIPENILEKAPTAELRENQKDTDSLPPYDILDDILHRMIEEGKSSEEIIAGGHGDHTVRKIANLILKAEYKRRQSPPGVKVTGLSFGRDRRYPITNGYRL